MKYQLTYSFDIYGLYVDEQDYNTITKKLSFLVASLGDYMIEDNQQFGRNIPPYDETVEKCIIKFRLSFRDFGFLEEGLKFLNAYCILHYMEEDESPFITTVID